MNICMVGHGMMGVWHSDTLREMGVTLHTLVGRREAPSAEFAARYGYRHWTLDLDAALGDPAIDAVVLTSPSELHAAQALACIAAGKPTLLEIPIAMHLDDAERVAASADASGLPFGLCHPMRFNPAHRALHGRLRSGEEKLRQMSARFLIHRLRNVGATGYQRSWTDNILWHHFAHFIDLGMWLLDFDGELAYSHLGELHPLTGTPMECTVAVENARDQTLLVFGSYHSRERIYDSVVVTDRDSYRLDILTRTLTTGDGSVAVEDEKSNLARVTRDFVDAVREGRSPAVPAASVLPAMRVIAAAQARWDARHGARSVPGRVLPGSDGIGGAISPTSRWRQQS